MLRLSNRGWRALSMYLGSCLQTYAFGGCGRVGVELLPVAGDERLIGGIRADGGGPIADAGALIADAGALIADASARTVDDSAVSVDGGALSVDGGALSVDGGPATGQGCDLTGTFALQIVMQTTWPNATYISGGSGPHVFWLRMQGTQSGNTVAESLVECGRSVPDFRASMVSETYNFSLGTSLFDAVPALVPSYAVPLTLSGTAPGASVTLPTSAFLLGTTITNPTTAAWPSTAAGLTQVDMDGDGNAGITVSYLNSGGHAYPLTGPSLSANRAQQPYVATRLAFSLNGTLTGCTQSSGPATVTHVDTRIFGCKLTNGSKCNGSEANFLDTNCVKYSLGTATYKMVKLADTATCSDVRAALP
jgi:hypothetical protein